MSLAAVVVSGSPGRRGAGMSAGRSSLALVRSYFLHGRWLPDKLALSDGGRRAYTYVSVYLSACLIVLLMSTLLLPHFCIDYFFFS